MFTQLDKWFTNPFISTLVSVLLGGLITWLAARVYYKKAGEDLKEEAALLRKANIAIVYLLEHPDAKIEVRRDTEGNPIGVNFSTVGNAVGRSNVKGITGDAKHEP